LDFRNPVIYASLDDTLSPPNACSFFAWLSSPMLRPTRLLHFDHPDGPSLAKLARSRTQPAQHSHSGPGLVRPVHAPTRGPRPYGPGPLQTQRALLPCCHSRPGARLPKSLPACSLYALGSLALHLSQPFCTLLLGFIGLALSRPSYHPLRRVQWRPTSPSTYLARVLRSQPEPARFIFSASGTRCNPLHRPARFQVGSSAHGLNLSRPASSSQRRAHGVNLYTGSRSHSSGVIGSPTGRPTARPSYQRMRCNSNNLSPSLGSQQVQALYPARGCRGPGQRQARLPGSSSSPSCPLDAGQPLIAGEVSKAGLARPKASPLLLSAGDENGVRFPWAAHAVPIQAPLRARNKWG
jgi:hypothetical protein